MNNQLIEGVNEAVSSIYYNSINKDGVTTSSRYSINKILQEEKTHLWNLPKMSTNEDNYTILNFNFKRNLTNKEKLNWLNNWVIEAEQGWLPTQSRNSSVILTMRAKSLWNYSTFPQPNLIKQLLTNLSSTEPIQRTLSNSISDCARGIGAHSIYTGTVDLCTKIFQGLCAIKWWNPNIYRMRTLIHCST